MTKQYRKKPVVIEAMQVNNDSAQEVGAWCKADVMGRLEDGSPYLQIATLEGVMTANVDDWVIKGVNGEFYPCKPDIFEKSYEPVERE